VPNTVTMPVLSEIRARVSSTGQAQAFFGQAFGWDFQPSQPDGAWETAVLPSRPGPPATLVLTDDPREPPVRLGFAASDITRIADQVEHLGGQIERRDQREIRGLDSQGTPLLFHRRVAGLGLTGRGARGALGVIFLFADSPEQAATFYHAIAGWNFDPIGGDRDILFVHEGPLVGIRAASQAPGGQGGTVQFHISVPDQLPAIEAIHDLGGHVGQERAAGIFSTRACTDDQGTAFSLWYQPARAA
jgi:predicted enzyme related to lactoylglutathione lyase